MVIWELEIPKEESDLWSSAGAAFGCQELQALEKHGAGIQEHSCIGS